MTATLAKLGHHAAHAEYLNWPAAAVLVAGMGFIAFLAWLCAR